MSIVEKRTVLTADRQLLLVELGAPPLLLDSTNNAWEVLSVRELEIKLPKKIDLSNPITEKQRLQKLNQQRHSNFTTIFPKVGEVYCCVESCQVELQIFFSNASSTHTRAVLPANEQIVISNVEEHPYPLWAAAYPQNPALEQQLIPTQEFVSGFSLLIPITIFKTHFQLTEK